MGDEEKWLATLGVRLLSKFQDEGATILEEFQVQSLGRSLRRSLTRAHRAHLDYVVEQILLWRGIESDFEGPMPWDENEPWTGPSYDPGPARRVLQRAIDQGLDVEMEYFTHSRGQFTTRTITPREMDGRYVVAYCHLRKDERTFRIERIKHARIVAKKKGKRVQRTRK